MTAIAQLFTRRTALRAFSGLAAYWLSRTSFGAAAGAGPRPASQLRISRAPLAAQAMYPLPLGAVKPAGWLRRQLEIQAAGLGGRLDETWPDVGPNSGWLGGSGESWERGPYYLDGLLPLAWQLDSAPLKAKAQRFIDWTLDHPSPDGMFGPRSNDDWWPRMVMLKVFCQYHDLTGDRRVIPVMTSYFMHQLRALPDRPLKDWGRFRWQDEIVSVLWLYNRTGDKRLLDLAELLRQQGFDWQGMFENFQFKDKVSAASIGLNERGSGDHQNGLKDLALSVHGVNNAQALKASPLWFLISGNVKDRDAVFSQLGQLDRYHGLPNGMFSADEHLAGRNPSQGVELCAIVETLYSLELAYAITGDVRIGDRIEKIAFNALPGAFTDDMWAHQYDQQPNQVECSLHKRPWTTNGAEANLFGLEPHFGCCTANFHQGWPKLTASLWMAGSEDELIAALYAPCHVETSIRDVPIRIEEVTDYPFRHRVSMAVHPARPVNFSIKLRIPLWCSAASVRVNGQSVDAGVPGGFARIQRVWRAGDLVEIDFTTAIKMVEGFNQSLSVEQGALVFSLPIGEAWIKLRQRGLSADWQVYPTTSWNYGLVMDSPILRHEAPVGAAPFSSGGAAVTLSIAGRLVPAWKSEEGAADPVPLGPVTWSATGEPAQLTLYPYAAPKLRITSFPRIAAQETAET